jgi:ribosomal protein S18 acetylase RimI-like enzyme
MIFNTLWAAAQAGELILIDGAMCHWHLCRTGQITIREIIVLPQYQRQGRGQAILRSLSRVPGAVSLLARCPHDLPANQWYERQGFHVLKMGTSKTGREITTWQRQL